MCVRAASFAGGACAIAASLAGEDEGSSEEREGAPTPRAGYDTDRGVAFTVFGGVLAGPLNYLWLPRLEALTRRLSPQLGHVRALLVRVCTHAMVFQPLIYLPTFYAVTALVRKWSPDELVRNVRETYTSTLTRLW